MTRDPLRRAPAVWFLGDPELHLPALVNLEPDRRLSWTRCGIRFAWGQLPRGTARPVAAYAECFA